MWRYRLGLAAITVAGLVVLRGQFAVVTVDGQSMLPTLTAGDRVLVRRAGLGQLRSGQVVVAESPGQGGRWLTPLNGPVTRREWLIKRVTAVPGDPRPAGLPPTAAPAEPRVPEGMFFVLGDNTAVSYDSRQIGYLPGDRLLGVVVRRMSRSRRSH